MIFTTNSPVNIQTGSFWIGERTSEGYGECVLADVEKNGKYSCKIADKPDAEPVKEISLSEYPALKGIADNLMRSYVLESACSNAFEKVQHLGKEDISIWKPVISDMLLMVSAGDVSEIIEACKKRYDVKDAEKKEKGKVAKKILHDMDAAAGSGDTPGNLMTGFEQQYHVTDYKPGDLRKQYLSEYLRQLKYSIRAKEEKPADSKREGAEWVIV